MATQPESCVPRQTPTHVERRALRSLRTYINLYDRPRRLKISTTGVKAPRAFGAKWLARMMIFFGHTPAYCRHGLTTRLLLCIFDGKESNTQCVNYVEDDGNYLHNGRSSPRYHQWLSRSHPDVIAAALYYHTVKSRATEHTTELAIRPWTLPPHLEWTTQTRIEEGVHNYILERSPPMSPTLRFLCHNCDLFNSYGILWTYCSLQGSGLSRVRDM